MQQAEDLHGCERRRGEGDDKSCDDRVWPAAVRARRSGGDDHRKNGDDARRYARDQARQKADTDKDDHRTRPVIRPGLSSEVNQTGHVQARNALVCHTAILPALPGASGATRLCSTDRRRLRGQRESPRCVRTDSGQRLARAAERVPAPDGYDLVRWFQRHSGHTSTT